MKARSVQSGMSLLSWLVVLFVVSLIATCAVKLLPVYMDAWTVKSVVESVAKKQVKPSTTSGEIRKMISRKFIANHVEAIDVKDIKIVREKGKIIIDANYEKRVPLMYNIDAVVKFENFSFEVPSSGQGD